MHIAVAFADGFMYADPFAAIPSLITAAPPALLFLHTPYGVSLWV